jgi:DNA-binding winged helix-turn-helix (wHTH) protein
MRIAELEVRAGERLIIGPSKTLALEPLVMALFIELTQHAGTIVSRRHLFAKLWGSLAVGDDSLNRLAAVLRRRLSEVGAHSFKIETVSSVGYILRLVTAETVGINDGQVQQALDEAVASWRLGLPKPDHLRIALLRRAVETGIEEPRVHGMLALQHRHAAEYCQFEQVAHHVHECERAAHQALSLDPQQLEALTALTSLRPLYGSWTAVHARLRKLCFDAKDHPVPAHDLAVLEMATGQVQAATLRRERLSARDPLAAIFAYKAVYQYWSLGDETAMDHAADQAMQLWPDHPAVWTARFWTFVYTTRLAAAANMTRQPPPGLAPTLVSVLADSAQSLRLGHKAKVAASARKLAGEGPPQAIAALFLLGALGAADECFEVTQRYYLHRQDHPVPLLSGREHPRLNEQNRRVTQILFTPACASMRADPRFADLTREIGLERFWREAEIAPDYQSR